MSWLRAMGDLDKEGTRVRVLALDPGKTTGVAEWGGEEPPMTDQIVGFEATLLVVAQWLGEWEVGEDRAVVMEDFVITPATGKKSRQNFSLELIGAVRWMCLQHKVKFVLQTASEAKAFVTDDRLKHIGWWVKGQDHARDALRHLLLFLIKTREIPPGRLV